MIPSASWSDISDPTNGIKIYNIVENTIKKLEGRFPTPVEFDVSWNIELRHADEIKHSWCKTKSKSVTSIKFKDCMQKDAVESYYDIGRSTLILKKTLLLDDAYDVGSIIHEVVHYVQHRHGLTRRGSYSLCVALLEYQAMIIEQELITDSGLYIPSWYSNYLNKWKNKFQNQLTDKPNCKL
jgi:hypothetical protein